MEEFQDKKIVKSWPIVIVIVGAFFCLFVFFTVAHPLYIYDTDDWTYIAGNRHALPIVHHWNPTKVLPETLMPFVAEIGVRFIMPFSGDYINAMMYAFAFVVAMFIDCYIYAFGKVIKKKFDLNDKVISVMLIILLLLHFLPFNVNESSNGYLFYSSDVTNYFNYMVPVLFNAITVMYLMTHHQLEWRDKNRNLHNGFVVLAIYLSINSNLFHSSVLMSYIGMRLIVSLVQKVYSNKYKDIRLFLKEYGLSNRGELLVSLVWFFSIVLESTGGRAQWGNNSQFLLKESIEFFVEAITEMNVFFQLGGMTVIILAFVVFIVSRIKQVEGGGVECVYCRWLYKSVICLTLVIIYHILLCACVNPSYIKREDMMTGWMFYLFLLMMGSLAYMVKKISSVCWFLPLMLYIVIFETVIDGGTYKNSYAIDYSADTIKKLDENLIEQVVEAERVGLDEVEVLVPCVDEEWWPIALSYGGGRISTSLYRHGITHKQMTIHLVMDQSVNDKFQLP